MKTIVIDARTIDSSTGQYIQHLLRCLNDEHADEFTFTILVPCKTKQLWQKKYPKLNVSMADEKSYSVAEQTTLLTTLESHKPDLVHFTMPQQPFLWVKPTVTTIHDLTLVHFDNVDMNRLIYKMKKSVFISLLRTVVMRSKMIITPTEYVKRDITNYFGTRYGKKIAVTHEAGDPIAQSAEPMKQFIGKRFVFSVNNAFPYKNIRLIIDAFQELQKTEPDLLLLLAGKKDFFYDELEKYVKENKITNVHFLGFISNGEKRWCFQNADAYVSASLSEGFNISLIEAMYEGCPAIISNATCHPEVAGDAALYFDPTSVEHLVTSLRHVLDSPSEREALITKGYERVKQFSWQRMADQTVAVYRQALGE